MLTETQKKAVRTIHKNILISAGAGTGKTRVLVERILHLLRTQKAVVDELLVLTFTEKAANEIKTRLSRQFKELDLKQSRRDLEKSSISTFHGFASRLLKEHPIEAGVDPDFRVIESEQSELLKEEALRETLEQCYERKEDHFELLNVYGEASVVSGISKVFTAARHEGKKLQAFFQENNQQEEEICSQQESRLSHTAKMLIRKLDGVDTDGWERFLKNQEWNWDTVRDFKDWSAAYKKQRKPEWKEWRELLETVSALRLRSLAMPWREKFEQMALAFETIYEAKKKEKGFLDFDDLQMKAVGLFRGEKPIFAKLRERYQKKYKFILIDEFQDTNFLQMEFVELLSSGTNLFMVGDYKQSIYSFRGAEPRIFLEKERLYESGEQGECFFLSESFRSEPPILDFINRFFKALWDEDGFPFEPLVPTGKDKAQPTRSCPAVEMWVTTLKEDEDMRYARLREARGIASKIRELHDKENMPYGDMAVLFQAMTLSGIYEDAFKSAGIPYFIVAGRGFYEQPEIQDIMCLLKHLEKPLADIPLAATLRSPLFHITDDTLFWLSRYAKIKDSKESLFHALKQSEKILEISGEQKERLQFFMTLTLELKSLKDRISLTELVDQILEKTGYELSLLVDRTGVRRYANLKKLIARIREYESYDRMSLASFLNILKRLQAQEVRESEAQIALETSKEAVRIMSIHGAKGLEFPVVFVADMGHQGSHADSKVVIAHAADGYAIQVRDETDLEMKKPYFFHWVDEKIKKREEDERKRLFYVAVTRAKSRLFLSGVYKKKKETKENFREMSSWMDWAMALCGDLGVNVIENTGEINMRLNPKPKVGTEEVLRQLEQIAEKSEKKEIKPTIPIAKDSTCVSPRSIDLPVSAYVLFQKDPQAFWRTYQIGWTVMENERAGESEDPEEGNVSAADFGTAMHHFLEHLDFKDPEKHFKTAVFNHFFDRFGESVTDEAVTLLKSFIRQPVFQRLQKARRIKREVDFVLNERHGLIQGKLDVLFEDEKGDWHILDYKTAWGDEEAAHQSAYDLQIEIYALAAQRILKIPVSSGIIYYLKNQKEVTIPLPSNLTADQKKVFFQSLGKKISGLQKKILDFSNRKMSANIECPASLG
ncbi:MAG TPA: UvrD-helicase domain-containing protein [Candidatus Omnitrophota bacterium]|nr:UvrD-helicase domain-containing protein [Candidatus Omnitrophota bacterium]